MHKKFQKERCLSFIFLNVNKKTKWSNAKQAMKIKEAFKFVVKNNQNLK